MTDSPQSRFRRFVPVEVLAVEVLVDAHHDTVHVDKGPSRPAKSVRLGARDMSPTPLVEDLPPRDIEATVRKYHCSNCGERGHSARSNSCGMTREQRNERERQRKKEAKATKP